MSKATLASLVVLGTALGASSAQASDYGCRVLLCLANPAGPMAVSACVPPISQLWRDLARVPPRPFPTCDEARPAIAVQNETWYDPCPEGTSALEDGTYGARQADPSAAFLGIGEGDNLQPGAGENATVLGSKVCVGRPIGQVSVQVGYGENATSVLANVYDRLALLDPATSPRAIDVFLNNALYRRVRW